MSDVQISDEEITMYINKYRSYINFMLAQQQWSGIIKADIDRWLSNFKGLKPIEVYYVYKLLSNLIYFSEKDVINALREGIHNHLFYNIILNKQKDRNFELSLKAISNILQDELRKTCFIPLLDSDSPHESGNYIARLLVQKRIIEAKQSMFLRDLVDAVSINKFSRLVIVDDCIGSGDQLRDFWNKNALVNINGNKVLLKDFCIKKNIEANYLTLFGYDQSITSLAEELSELKICCVRMLSDEQRVFSEKSYIWNGETELKKAEELFTKLTIQGGISLLGYRNLDFAFIMHQTIPDWSLPLFWKENSSWKLLIGRKNSND